MTSTKTQAKNYRTVDIDMECTACIETSENRILQINKTELSSPCKFR